MANQFLVAMTVGALAISLIAIGIGGVCRAASPSVRNLVWNAALLACVCAPLAWTFGPRLVIPAPATFGSSFSKAVAAPTSQNGEFRDPSAIRGGGSPVAANGARHASKASSIAVLLIWFLGVLFVFFRFGRQLFIARRLVHGGKRFTNNKIYSQLATAKATLGIRIDVSVLESIEIDIPIATGILHPAILFPAYANEWPTEDLRLVLLHELAHVRRADVLARAAAMIACGLHWFNPVVWLLSRLAARDAELAADDLVLRAGVRPSSYAATLLSLADRVLNWPNAQPVMSLAQRPLLADRVHEILRQSRIPREIGECTRSTVLVGSCAVAMLAACIRFSPPASKSVPTSDPRPAKAINAAGNVTLATMPARPLSSPLNRVPIRRHGIPRVFDATSSPNDSAWISSAIDALIVTLDDPSPQVRGGAAGALGRLGAVRAQPGLGRLLNDSDKFVRYEARQALSEMDQAR